LSVAASRFREVFTMNGTRHVTQTVSQVVSVTVMPCRLM
jgi:hypothetical protein